MALSQQIEALLFFRGDSISLPELTKLLGKGTQEVESALKELEEDLGARGLRLVRSNKEVTLATAPEAAELLEKLQKEELNRDLGKAGAETLAIVLYNAPVTRAEIDYIRGVNSTFILRNLLIRGLIERDSSKKKRGFIYRPTLELLTLLGITNIEELPEFATVRSELADFAKEGQDDTGKTD